MKAIFQSIAAFFVSIFMFLFGWAMPKQDPPIHPDAGYYYDLFQADSGFLGLHSEAGEFTDASLSTYALIKGGYEMPISEADAIIERHFGRKIQNYDNGTSYTIPGTDRIALPGGCGYPEAYMVLIGDLTENSDGSVTGTFKNYSLDAIWEDYERRRYDTVREYLLSGKASNSPKPELLRVTFEVREDAGGEYLFYHSVENV